MIDLNKAINELGFIGSVSDLVLDGESHRIAVLNDKKHMQSGFYAGCTYKKYFYGQNHKTGLIVKGKLPDSSTPIYRPDTYTIAQKHNQLQKKAVNEPTGQERRDKMNSYLSGLMELKYHDYFKNKGIDNVCDLGLLLGDKFQIIAPLKDANGLIKTYIGIHKNGFKGYPEKLPVSKTAFHLPFSRTINENIIIHFCEGIATGISIKEAVEDVNVKESLNQIYYCVGSKNNLEPFINEIREKIKGNICRFYPDHEIPSKNALAQHNVSSATIFKKACESIGGQYIDIEEIIRAQTLLNDNEPYDFNDIAVKIGKDALKDILKQEHTIELCGPSY